MSQRRFEAHFFFLIRWVLGSGVMFEMLLKYQYLGRSSRKGRFCVRPLHGYNSYVRAGANTGFFQGGDQKINVW